MARNIGESLNEQNIVLETKEDKYKGNRTNKYKLSTKQY